MQNLILYIKQLLLVHDCVIIPQLGGFVSNYKPAYYNSEKQCFCPPSKEVTFNSHLSYNDGLLCQQIMKHEGVNFAEAQSILQVEIEKIQKELASGSCDLKGFGTFTKNDNGILQFEQNEHNNLLKSSFGLKPFECTELKLEDKADRDSKIRTLPNDKLGIKQFSRYAVAVAASIIVLLLFFPTHLSDKSLNEAGVIPAFDTIIETMENNESENHPVLDQKMEENTADDTDINESRNTLEVSERSENHGSMETLIENEEYNKSIKLVSGNKYHIIIASLTNKKQALIFVEKYCKKTYPNYSIIESNGRFRVSIDNFTDKAVAVPVLDTFKVTHPKFSDAWLLTIKPTV